MTKEELKELQKMTDYICSLSSEDFFNFFYEKSPSFKRCYDNLNFKEMA